jgi:hypothetical protein
VDQQRRRRRQPLHHEDRVVRICRIQSQVVRF